MSLRRPRRIDGFSYRGFHRYFLTFCTHGRERLFVSRERVDAALEQFQRTTSHEGFALLAYCFMPDHVQVVLEGESDDANMRRAVSLMKQRAAYVFRITFGVPLMWQEGYYERVLRSEEATDVVVRYVLDNPVRAGLVARHEDYPFMGAKYWPEAT
jgi:putative transposase